MRRELAAWRELYADAPPLLLEYVEARGLLLCALRFFHASAERLALAEEAAFKAWDAREIRRDLEGIVRRVRYAADAKARRRAETKHGITGREAAARLRALPRRTDELRAWVALAAALDDFDACAALVEDAAWVVTRRHYAWRRWEAARDLAAAAFGVTVCRYVPKEQEDHGTTST